MSEGASPWKHALKDLTAGTAAGMVSKVIEFPFDTVKVRLQTQDIGATAGKRLYAGPWDCLKSIVKESSILGLYKGLSPPLAGAMLENAVNFTVYGNVQRLVRTEFPDLHPIVVSSIGGASAGFAVAHVLTPVELVKCRLQAAHSASMFSGPLDVLRDLSKSNEGIVRGLFRGHVSTLLREIPGGLFYFGVYETSIQSYMGWKGPSGRDQVPALYLMGSGSLGGMAYWLSTYPADVIKSKQQAMIGSVSSSDVRMSSVFKQVMKQDGIRGFYSGLGVTLIRAIPANAAIFYTYETLLQIMKPL
jgi:hypothetical protein